MNSGARFLRLDRRSEHSSRIGWGFVIGIAVFILSFFLDDSVHSWLEIEPGSGTKDYANSVSHLGEGWVVLAGGVAASAFLCWRRKGLVARGVVLVTAASLLTGATATLLRGVVGRTRPHAAAPQGIYGLRCGSQWTIGRYQFASLPSGHTATAAGFAVALVCLWPRWRWAAGGYVAAIGWSRIALGCHHFSDVVAAILLAMYCAPPFLRFLTGVLPISTAGGEGDGDACPASSLLAWGKSRWKGCDCGHS